MGVESPLQVLHHQIPEDFYPAGCPAPWWGRWEGAARAGGHPAPWWGRGEGAVPCPPGGEEGKVWCPAPWWRKEGRRGVRGALPAGFMDHGHQGPWFTPGSVLVLQSH